MAGPKLAPRPLRAECIPSGTVGPACYTHGSVGIFNELARPLSVVTRTVAWNDVKKKKVRGQDGRK
jgi:hypothetical protein